MAQKRPLVKAATRSVFDTPSFQLSTSNPEVIRRRSKMKEIANDDTLYTSLEDQMIETKSDLLSSHWNNSKKKKVKTAFHQASLYLLNLPSDPRTIGLSRIEMNCSPLEFVAYMFDQDAPCRSRASDLERGVIEEVNPHHNVVCQCTEGFHGTWAKPREGLIRCVFKKVSSNKANLPETYFFASENIEHSLRPLRSDRVRGLFEFNYKIERLAEDRCRVTTLGIIDLGGSLPRWVSNFYTQYLVDQTDAHWQIQKRRSLSCLNAKDGEAMGAIFMINLGKKLGSRKVQN